jgi:predicted small lipoprotein YifL
MTSPRLPVAGTRSVRARRKVGLASVAHSALVAFLCVTLAACGIAGPTARPSAPTASPTTPPDPATVYAAIEEQVRAIRGLEEKAPVQPKVLDEAALSAYVKEQFRKDNPEALVKANERMLKVLGLLPADASLEDLYISLLSGVVAGLYNPRDKTLYVVSRSGGLGPTEKTTFAHEYTHALQDQNFGLAGLELDAPGKGDQGMARLALVEGDATLLMTLWQIDHLSQAELIQLLGESLDPAVTGPLEKMPAVLRESLMFSYTGGLNFAQRLQSGGGWAAVDAAFGKPPASTEQILHPEKYDSGEAPTVVDLPNDLAARMGAGWSLGLEDTLGEFQLRLWLANAAGGVATDQANATKAAAGWGGDRVAVLDGPGGSTAVVIRAEWDTASDAAEFAAQAKLVVPSLSGAGDVLAAAGGTNVTVVLAPSADLVSRLKNILAAAG